MTIVEENTTKTKMSRVNERTYFINDRYGDIKKYIETPINDKSAPLKLLLITTENMVDGRKRLITTNIKNAT